MPIKPKKEIEIAETFTCFSCGASYNKQKDNFFKSTWSKLWKYNNKYVPVCKVCLDGMMQEMTSRYGSEEVALKIICHYMDVPFYSALYHSIIEKNNHFSFGMYSRQILNNRQYQNKTFQNSIVDGELSKTESEVKEERIAKWSVTDKRNMDYAISIVGYDPYENLNLTDADRKYCFNILAGYCDIESVKEDGHKLQCVIQLTNLHLQCKEIDEMIYQEMLECSPNEQKIKTLTASKKTILDSLSRMAQDNNISSNYNKNSNQGKGSMTSKMKEMEQNGFEEIEVNLFDIKTSKAFKQIADLSNQSIMEQLMLDDNDYTGIISEQREMIQEYESKTDELTEENRILKNKIIDLENNKG